MKLFLGNREVQNYCQFLDQRHLPIWKRGHWSIENKLHRVLDMTFREDDFRW